MSKSRREVEAITTELITELVTSLGRKCFKYLCYDLCNDIIVKYTDMIIQILGDWSVCTNSGTLMMHSRTHPHTQACQ